MQIKIPRELLKYVRMSKGELIHSEDMPDELKPLFEETKKQVEDLITKNKREIEGQ